MRKFFVLSALFAALLVAGFGIQTTALASDNDSPSSEISVSGDSNSSEDNVSVCQTSENETLTMTQSEYETYYRHQHGYMWGACGDDDEVAYACECPPGVACTCADGSAGEESGAPTAAGPSQYRSF